MEQSVPGLGFFSVRDAVSGSQFPVGCARWGPSHFLESLHMRIAVMCQMEMCLFRHVLCTLLVAVVSVAIRGPVIFDSRQFGA